MMIENVWLLNRIWISDKRFCGSFFVIYYNQLHTHTQHTPQKISIKQASNISWGGSMKIWNKQSINNSHSKKSYKYVNPPSVTQLPNLIYQSWKPNRSCVSRQLVNLDVSLTTNPISSTNLYHLSNEENWICLSLPMAHTVESTIESGANAR